VSVLTQSRAARASSWVVAFDPDHDRFTGGGFPDLETVEEEDARVHFSGTLDEMGPLIERIGLPRGTVLSPAAIVLSLYSRFGASCFNWLSGRYAIVIEDRPRRRVTAVRDRVGLYPLFHAQADGAWFFASSIDALLSRPEIPRTLDRVVLAEYLAYRWPDLTQTCYAAIRRVPPGHLLEAGRDGSTLRRYWDLASRPLLAVGYDEAQERFDHAFERAVVRGLDAGRPAVFLSGGFDSISVAAVATDLARQRGAAPPLALSLGFDDPACNEEVVQRGVARALDLQQEFLHFEEAVRPRGLLTDAVDLCARSWAPLMNTWTPAFASLAARGRDRGCRVLLTGTGGDEWLGVTPCLAADLLKSGRLVALTRFAGMLKRSYRMSALQALTATMWRFGGRRVLGMVADRLVPGAFQAQRARRLVASTPKWLAPDPGLRRQLDARAPRVLESSQPAHGSFYQQGAQTALDHPLVSMEHEEWFQFGQRLGLSVVHPYCDADLVELLYCLPPDVLIQGGRSKALVRATVARRFPAFGFDRHRKVSATDFYTGVLRREGPAALERLGGIGELARLGLVDAPKLTAELDRLASGASPHETYRIWSVLSLVAWTRSRW
jgi:asparagine synthase (glutamine-hydrolysing)